MKNKKLKTMKVHKATLAIRAAIINEESNLNKWKNVKMYFDDEGKKNEAVNEIITGLKKDIKEMYQAINIINKNLKLK